MHIKIQPMHVALALFVLAIAALLAFGIRAFPEDTGYAGVGPRFYPTVIALFLALVGVLLLLQGLTGGFRDLEAEDSPERDWTGVAYVAGALLLHAALLTKIGFVLSATILFTVVARGFGSRKPVRDALAGAALALPVFWLFTRALDVSLPALLKPWF